MINFLLIHIVTSFHVVFIVLSSADYSCLVKRTFIFAALHKNFVGKGKGKVTRWAILRVCLVRSSTCVVLGLGELTHSLPHYVHTYARPEPSGLHGNQPTLLLGVRSE